MKRGPSPNKGLGFALPVALALGRVMFFMASPYYPGDFMIVGEGYLGIIRLRLSEKIRATIAGIQTDFSRSIAELASLPRGGPVCYELWIYSRYGRLRFFNVSETGLNELDRSAIISKRNAERARDLSKLLDVERLPVGADMGTQQFPDTRTGSLMMGTSVIPPGSSTTPTPGEVPSSPSETVGGA
jgi:hypothetical protein